ncbi:MAG: hypothetical protein J6N49_05150 [Alphaproteobacteria bacterium]|nr:hypothetical protein [Alphaproteobacteria bacterium]
MTDKANTKTKIKANTKEEATAQPQKCDDKYLKMLTVALLAVVIGSGCGFYYFNQQLKQAQNNVEKLSAELQNSQIVYIYNLEAVVASSNLVMLKQEFETKINELIKEVDDSQQKIKNMKNAKVKDDFSDVYMKSLKLKRDETIKAYDETMIQATENINLALKEVALAKGAKTIFNAKAIAFTSKYTVDITPEVIELVNKKNASLKMP